LAAVQLSILLPTNRHDLLAISRIVQACSWARPDIEVIVRDNSGNAEKRDLLTRIHRDNCKIVIVEPSEASENFSSILKLARGEFVFCLADDDMSFDRAIDALPGLLASIAGDKSIIGVTGPYIIEAKAGPSVLNYRGLDAADVAARVSGYLTENGPNALFYSVQRRDMAQRIFDLLGRLPVQFTYHDQVLSLLYLLNGKFAMLPRLFYLYDFGVWEKTETGQNRDLRSYTAEGMDASINVLHWFMCGFEGAVLALHYNDFPDHPQAQRQAVANVWFSTMFVRFKSHKRLTFGSPHAETAEKAAAKLQATAGAMSFDAMLAEITAVMALSSKSKAQAYFDFWNAMLTRRATAA
jgi:hypothetical protein